MLFKDLMLKTAAVTLCFLLVMVGLVQAVEQDAQSNTDSADEAWIAALGQRLESNEELQEAVSDPLPARLVVETLQGVSPERFAEALAHAQVHAVRDLLDPGWVAQDPEEVRAFMLHNFDEQSGLFVFDSLLPDVDALVARLVLAHVAVQELTPSVSRSVSEGLVGLLETGEIPNDWEVTHLEPLGTQEEAQDEGPGPQGEVEWQEAPQDPEPHPYSEYVDGDGEAVRVMDTGSEQLNYFLAAGAGCPMCGQSMGAFNSPLVATFDLGDLPAEAITEAELQVRTFDVDWFVSSPCGTPIEKDNVFINGNHVGHLTGENEKWSVTPFTMNPDWFVDGTNEIKIWIDVLGNGCWRATTSWLQVTLEGETGPVEIVEITTDRDGYNLGDTIQATATVRTDAEEPDPYPASLSFNLHNPDGDIPSQTETSVSLPRGEDVEVEFELEIPSDFDVGTAEVGRWTVVGTAFDKDGVFSDREDREVGVGTDVAITEDQVEHELVGSNPDSGSITVEIGGEFSYSSAAQDPQTFTVTVYGLRDGEVYTQADQEHTIPGDDSGTMSLEPVELQLDAGSDPAVRVTLDSKGDLVEVDKDNNEVEVPVAKPQIVEFRPNVWGNYVADRGLDRQAFFAVTEGPGVAGEVEGVRFTVETAAGGAIAGPVEVTQTTSPDTYKWDYDTGRLDKGQYVVKAVAFTDTGTESEPETYEFWTFGPPWMLSFLDSTFSAPLWDPFTPRYETASSGEGFSAKYGGNLGVGFKMELGSDPMVRVLKAVIREVGPALCINDPEIEVGFSLKFEHEVISEDSTWGAKISLGRTVGSPVISGDLASFKIFGKTFSMGAAGSGTWDFQSDGEWLLKDVGFEGNLGMTFECSALRAILSWLRVPSAIANTIAEHFAELKLTLGVDGKLTVVLDRDAQIVWSMPLEEMTVGPTGTLSMFARAGPKILSATAEFTGSAGFTIGYRNGPGWGFQGGLCPNPCGATFKGTTTAEVKDPIWGTKIKLWDKEWIIHEWTGPTPPDSWLWPKGAAGDHEDPVIGQLFPADPGTGATLPPEVFHGGENGLLLEHGSIDRTTAAIAVADDGTVLVLFDRDDPEIGQDPVSGIASIGAAERTNGEWSDEGILFGGDHFEAIPRVAVSPTGHAIAAWERIDEIVGSKQEPDLDRLRVVYALRDDEGAWSEPRVIDPDGVGRQHLTGVEISPTGDVAAVSWDAYGPGELTANMSTPNVAAIIDGELQEKEEVAPADAHPGLSTMSMTPTGQILMAYTTLEEDLNATLWLTFGDARTGVWLEEPLRVAGGENAPRSPVVATHGSGATVAWAQLQNGTHAVMERSVPSLPRVTADATLDDAVLGPTRTVVPANQSAPALIEDLRLVHDEAGLLVFVWNDLIRSSVRTLAYERDPLEGVLPEDVIAAHAPLKEDLESLLPELQESPVTDALQKRLEEGAVGGLDDLLPRRSIVDVAQGPVRSVDAAYDPDADSVVVVAARHVEDHADGEPMQIALAERPLGADLEVSILETDPGNPAPGQEANVSAVVTNVGERLSPPATLAFTANEALIGAGGVPALQPGHEERVNITWQVPNMTRQNELTAHLHFDAATGDADPDNDRLSRNVTIPELVAVDLSSHDQANTVRLFATVENQGVLASDPTEVVFLDGDGSRLGGSPVASLGPGEAGAATLTVPVGAFGAGTSLARVIVKGDQVREAPPGEETGRGHLVTILPDPTLVDARVEKAVEGEPAHLRLTVENRGGVPSPENRIEVRLEGQAIAQKGVAPLGPGEKTDVLIEVDLPDGDQQLRLGLDPDHDHPDGSRSNNVAFLNVKARPVAVPAVNEAGLHWTPDGAQVTLHNRGPGTLTGETFALYRGEPQDRDPYGPSYVTKIENLFALGGIGDIPGHEPGSTHVDEEDIVIRVTRPDLHNREIRLADLAADETVSLRLDPWGTSLDKVSPGMVIAKPLVSIASSTHPDPERAGPTTATFELATAPGHTAGGYSFVLDEKATTNPDTTVDTTDGSLSFDSLQPGTHYLHVRAQLSSGDWTATDHHPVTVAGVDTTPPETRLRVGSPSLKHAPDAYGVSTDTPLQLGARDDASGVAATHYRFGDGDEQIATGPFTAPAGESVLSYWSVDEAGNQEAPRSVQLDVETGVDTLAPVTEPALDPGGVPGPQDEQVFVRPGTQISLDATDPWQYDVARPSGVATTWYQWEGEDPTQYTGPFQAPSTQGPVELIYWSEDLAGNLEDPVTLRLHVDDSPPEARFLRPEQDDVVAGVVDFVVEARDERSGVDRVELHHEGGRVAVDAGGNAPAYVLTVDTGTWPLGNNEVTATAHDALGNQVSIVLRVYVASRSVHVPPDEEELVDRLLPQDVKDLIEEVTP